MCLLYPLQNYSPFKTKRQIVRISPTVFHKKQKWPTQIQIPGLKKRQMLLCKETFWFYQKKLILTKCWNVLLTTYLLCLVDIFFNRQLAFSLVPTVLLFQPTFSFTLTGLHKKNEKPQSQSFNFTFCYTENVLSLNNSKVGDFVDQIYPNEHEIKDNTGTARSASYLDLHLEIDSESRIRTKCYDKRRADNTMSVQTKMDKRANNGLQNITQKTRDRGT